MDGLSSWVKHTPAIAIMSTRLELALRVLVCTSEEYACDGRRVNGTGVGMAVVFKGQLRLFASSAKRFDPLVCGVRRHLCAALPELPCLEACCWLRPLVRKAWLSTPLPPPE